MGLGAPKKRAKLSHDPNNTTWSRSSTKYGQRILESQGWTPGNFLGAKEAPYAALHTQANASHVRVALKDDNLGLGAKYGSRQENGSTTGLDMFQDILGRLNGKSKEESERDQSQRSTVQRSAFIHHRWGRLHFISGGLLAGDELQKLPKMGCANIQPNEAGLSTEEKGTNGTMAGHNNSRPEVGKSKKRKKSKLFEQRERQSGSNKNSSSMLSSESFNEFSGNGESSPPEARLDDAGVAGKSDKTQRRGEKVERRLQKKLRREARQVARRETSDSPAALASSESRDSRLLDDREERRRRSTVSEGVHGSKRPLGVASGRMAVRRRYIEHKKMSMMDSKALNEILMVKA